MELKPFQADGRDFLASRRYALLADEMRLGKTAQAITAARRACVRNVLVICPAIATTHWQVEFDRWWPDHPPVHVLSYDYARRHKSALIGVGWDLLILDEAHYLKTPSAARTRAVLGRNGIASVSKRVWALTGTPVPNHAGELWTMAFTFGVTKRSYENFLSHFCYVDPFSGQVRGTKPDNLPELRAMLKPMMRRNLKVNVAPELPPCTLTPWYVMPDPEYMDIVRPVNTEILLDDTRQKEAEIKAIIKDMAPDEMLDYLNSHLDALATIRKINGMLKVPALLETLDFELGNGVLDKCVVFGYHRHSMYACSEMLRGRGWRTDIIYGGTTQKKRDAMLRRFDRKTAKGGKGTHVLFAQILAAGTAIDLSASHEGFLLERDWVPGNNAQALERMGGYRQTMPVTIRDIIIPGSIDDIVSSVLARKMRDISDIYCED